MLPDRAPFDLDFVRARAGELGCGAILERDNPWILDPKARSSLIRHKSPKDFIPRTLIQAARSRWTDVHRAHLLIGPRQAGKSTAIWAHLAETGEAVLWIDCEQSLAGRATRARLFPFALSEVCGGLADSPPLVREREIRRRLDRHLIIGGYPAVWLDDNPRVVLTDLLEAFVLRDAGDLFRIARPDAFRRLLQLAAGQCGSLVNFSEWASLLGVSRDTVASYLEILESSHVTVSLPPFVGGKRSELTRSRKLYFVDSGIRNQLLNDLRPMDERADAGAVLESWVFTELWKILPSTAGLHYWRSSSNAEVDFVLTHGETIIGLEVKAGNLQRPAVSRSSRSFIEAYRPSAFFVTSPEYAARDRIGPTEVRWIPPQEVASAVGELLGS